MTNWAQDRLTAQAISRAAQTRTVRYIIQPQRLLDQYSAGVQVGARIVVPEVPAGEEKTKWGEIPNSVASILTSAPTIVLVVQRL
jgi:hypothetical protein